MKTCTKCKEEKVITEYSKQRNGKNGLRAYCKKCAANMEMKRKFGITMEEYERILVAQGGGCKLCGKTPEENGKMLAIDHDHSCCNNIKTCGNCVRGLLCTDCNLMLGLAKDNVALLRLAISYLNN